MFNSLNYLFVGSLLLLSPHTQSQTCCICDENLSNLICGVNNFYHLWCLDHSICVGSAMVRTTTQK